MAFKDWSAPKRRRRVLAGLAGLAVILAVWSVFPRAPAKTAAPSAIPVTVATAQRQDFPVTITELGAAQAWTSVTILSQVSGKLISVNFREGSEVKAGDVLAEVDPTPYRAALEQAQGTLRRDLAALADAKLNLARYKALQAQNSIATQQVDTQAALVRQDEGVVESDRGTVATATTNLRWCRIVSPINGRAGVRFVDPGNLVSASGGATNTPATAAATNTSNPGGSGGSGIVIINQIQPIAVTFTVPEAEFENLVQASNGFRVPLVTQAYSQESGALLDTGELAIADNRIDPSTGTVELKARFPNANNRLWPGQFVNVRLTLQTLHNATTIPVTALNRGPDGTYVYVIAKDRHAEARPVKLTVTGDTLAGVASGVKPGELVVVDGQMSLRTGSLVRIANAGPAQKRRRT